MSPPPEVAAIEARNAIAALIASVLQQALALGSEKLHWKFAGNVVVDLTVNGIDQTLATLPKHLAIDVRRYFMDWAAFNGAGDLFAGLHPVRLTYYHLGRKYDLTLTLDISYSLTVKAV